VPEGTALVMLWGVAILAATACLALLVGPLRRAPSDRQLARLIEECCPELDDALVTAVAEHDASATPRPMLIAVVGDALRRARGLDLDRVISSDVLRKTAMAAAAFTVVLAVLGVFSAPPAGRAAQVFALYAFPERIVLDVTPGDVKVRAGQPLRILARIPGSAGGVVPVLRHGDGKEWRETRMEAEKDGRGFGVGFERVDQGFKYTVAAAGATSREYSVTVIRPPRVERIDLRYEYPTAFGLKPRVEEDSGDIYGPAGTRVRVIVQADKPITSASMNLAGGQRLALVGAGSGELHGEIVISEDTSYRVGLADADGLSNPGDTEYFIRTLEDRPPDVRIVRPADDKQVTPIEEVAIEARADDDFGVSSFDLVYSVRGGPEKAVPFRRDGSGMTVNGSRTVYLEDLDVEPGDFVTYYARARDVSRGKRSSEARSDIFFLEVKPFEEEFVAAQSQAMSGMGGDRSLDDLAAAQKDIIVATWKLDRRNRGAGGQSAEDIRNVARAQAELRKRAEGAAGQLQRGRVDPRRRIAPRPGAPNQQQEAAPSDDPMTRAVDAMGKAQQQLESLRTSEALPHEMAALNELLKAQADVKRRQVQRQQNAMGRGGSNRQQQDLSSLFDRELARQQSTNYETPNSSETREDKSDDNNALDKIKELARRQDALNQRQQELAKQRESMTEEELRRELERLTREQSELRRQAEELSRQMQEGQQQGQQQGQQSSRSQSQGQSHGQGQGQQSSQSQRQENARAMREAAEEMNRAASDLRRKDLDQAAARGSRASERMRDLEQRMRSSQPDDRRRALGELQLEARQLADAQRRLAAEAEREAQRQDQRQRQQQGQGQGGASPDAARRRAAEQERLADRAQRLEQGVKQLAAGAQGADADNRKALADAARELDRQKLAERMRNAAKQAREGAGAQGEQADPTAKQQGNQAEANAKTDQRTGAREGQEIARTLDRVADRLGAANGQNAESRRLADELSRRRDQRERVAELDRRISELRRSGGERQPNQGSAETERGGDPQQRPGQGQASPQGQQGQTGQQAKSEGGRGGGEGARQQEAPPQTWQQARELLDELRREEGLGLHTPTSERFNPGLSAPGTEAWKQDFAKWEELKVQIDAALEKAETSIASKLREQESKDRLNAGQTQAVPEQYRRLVDKYYRALAQKKR
jgi:hypothetical protein